jgi:hypothetical protein
MKKIISTLLIILASTLNAQVVNIPDPVFKQLLINDFSINTNQDNEIQISEALVVDSLDLRWNKTNTNSDSINGIEEFKNLVYLNLYGAIKYSQLTTYHLDFSSNTKLKTLNIGANSVGSVNLTANINLERLDATETSLIDTLDLSNNTKLIWLDIYGDLDVICLPSLDIVNSNFNKPSFIEYSENCSLITNTGSFSATGISLSPNPFNKNLQINGTLGKNAKIRVFNNLGSLVHEQNLLNSKVEISHLENGIYFFEITSGNKKSIHKMVKK